MALSDSLEKLIASRQKSGMAAAATPDPRDERFAPVVQRLRRLIGGVDSRYIKSKLTRSRAVIRVGNGGIDLGWDISPNPAYEEGNDATPLLKVCEMRDFMSDTPTSETLWFAGAGELVEYLERQIDRQTAGYSH